MKKTITLFAITFLSIATAYGQKSTVDKDIKMYTQLWDNVVNKRQINQINSTHFDTNITLVSSPKNIVGMENFKAYYQNFLTGFSKIQFTIVDIFGQGDKLVKHWNFKGKHTGDFFGIPATGNRVAVSGVTLVKMKNGKIAQEQDFMDNMIFMQQLGLTSNPANVGIIDGLYKAFAAGDIPKVLAGLDEKIVWNEAEGNLYADGNPYIGPEAVLKGVFARIGAEHDYFKLVNIQLHEMSNNQVLATLRYEGKLKKNGVTFNTQAAHLWTIKDGKAIAFQQYADTKQLAEVRTK